MKKMKKKEKKARKKIEKNREKYLRCSQVKTDEKETGQEETGQEDKHWEELISILAGEAKLMTDIKRNLLIILNEMQINKEEKKHNGY